MPFHIKITSQPVSSYTTIQYTPVVISNCMMLVMKHLLNVFYGNEKKYSIDVNRKILLITIN